MSIDELRKTAKRMAKTYDPKRVGYCRSPRGVGFVAPVLRVAYMPPMSSKPRMPTPTEQVQEHQRRPKTQLPLGVRDACNDMSAGRAGQRITDGWIAITAVEGS